MRSAAVVTLLSIAIEIAPTSLTAQWSVSVDRPNGARPASVVAMAREVADSLGEEPAVSLVLRCAGRTLDAFLSTRDQLDSDTNGDVRVRVQADSMRPRDARWQATKSSTGAFLPAPDLREIIQRGILHSRTIQLTTTTQKRGRVTYVFPVADFRQALDALRDACPNDRGGALAEPSK